MRSHELARILLEVEDADIECSVDISTGDDDIDSRAFGDFVEIGHTPCNLGFGISTVMLLFAGNINKQ